MKNAMIYSALMVAIFSVLPSIAAEIDQGPKLDLQYCSSCHGKDGRGNGPVAPYLKIKVPDLTVLKKKNSGIYPLDYVMSTIDGRRAVRAHGDRQMPVWGEIFHGEIAKENIRNAPRC